VFRADVESRSRCFNIAGRCRCVFGCLRCCFFECCGCCFFNVADVVLNVAKSHVDSKHQGPMLQICDVRCCVEGGGAHLMLDVANIKFQCCGC
jgi:hypothetical protein